MVGLTYRLVGWCKKWFAIAAFRWSRFIEPDEGPQWVEGGHSNGAERNEF
jgi:hypothetical protein